jgi:hypothetical protein
MRVLQGVTYVLASLASICVIVSTVYAYTVAIQVGQAIEEFQQRVTPTYTEPADTAPGVPWGEEVPPSPFEPEG